MTRRISIITLFVIIGFLAGLVLTGRMRTSQESAAQQPDNAAPPEQPRPVPGAPQGLPDLTGVAQRAIGSVTNISSTQPVRASSSPFANDPFFRYFFGDDDPFGYRERRQQSLGSGV